MSATAAMVAQLRRMVSEPTTAVYADSQLTTTIELYPVHDSAGLAPDDEDWTATYDLNAAAADLWLEKAGHVADTAVDHQEIDAAGRTRWQGDAVLVQNAMRMHRIYAARRVARSSSVLISDEEVTA